MNDYGFDYMNYITSIPNNINYSNPQKTNINYTINNQKIPSYKNQIKDKFKTINPTEGWLKGNLFKDSYEPYKNYKPANLNPQNEKEALLYQVMQYKFALTELDLYLDTNPNDTEMINLYNQYLNIEKQMSDKYESMYGPLTLDSNYLNKNNWIWKNSPWPWEVM